MEQLLAATPTTLNMAEGIQRDIIWSSALDAAAACLGDYLETRPFPPVNLRNEDGSYNRGFLIGTALLQCARDLNTGKALPRLDDYIQQHATSREGTRTQFYMQPAMSDAADQICLALLKLPNPPFYATWRGKPNQTFAVSVALFYAVDRIASLPAP